MANKLPWFPHFHDAHNDAWVRNLVRKQGHSAGWIWWVLCELFHDHGVGDVLKYDLVDVARAAMTSTSVVTRVLTEMATEFQGQQKVRFNISGTELLLEIPKQRKILSKLKSNIPVSFRQTSGNVRQEVEREGERELPLLSPSGDGEQSGQQEGQPQPPQPEASRKYSEAFERFWSSYPAHRRVAKKKAYQIWNRLKPGPELVELIIKALDAQKTSQQWTKEGGDFVPHPTTWLNQGRWEDEMPPGAGGPQRAVAAINREGQKVFVRNIKIDGRVVAKLFRVFENGKLVDKEEPVEPELMTEQETFQ